ncbi:MAG: hypothetical protein KIS30_03975 [Thermoplasmata archaeon]|nr:hypothetical protein [Candidatus Sysuiplasma acidicola]MBX8645902.1 hypothetical protein [Candidatus Sysuiplasma acidicola]
MTEIIGKSDSGIDLNVTVPTITVSSEKFKTLRHSVIESAANVGCNVLLIAVEDSLPSFRFSKSVNRGFAEFDADYYVNVNDDILLQKTSLSNSLHSLQKDDEIGILAGIHYNPDGTIQDVGYGVALSATAKYYAMMVLKYHAPFDAFRKIKNYKERGISKFVLFYDYKSVKEAKEGLCGGPYQMINKSALKLTGGYDENYVMGLEDTDFCLRVIQNGLKARIDRRVGMTHERGASGINYWKSWSEDGTRLLYSKFSANDILRLVRENGQLISNSIDFE